MQTFCWFIFDEPAKSLHTCKLSKCKLFAGSSKMNQQKVCQFDFCMKTQTRSYRASKEFAHMQKSNRQTFCWFIFVEPAKSLHMCKLSKCKLLAGSFSTNQQKVCTCVKCRSANFLLVHFRRTSKKFVHMQNVEVQTFCWFVENEPAKSLSFRLLHGKANS